ncbi:anti-sigma factor [Paenibacillus hodogayensis]|uniref:Regulator of SigK n=1 Tax=Paenibacillus hodogayensis TaxID=279208 RepID=A0ABV5VVC2_9BACL
MKNNPASACDLRLDVLSGSCTKEERLAFERHLPGCDACRAENEELQLIWEALYADMELIEPPRDLKQQVMNAALAADADLPEGVAQTPNDSKPGRTAPARTRRWLPATAGALLLAALAVGTAWNVSLYRDHSRAPIPIEQALSVPASQVKQVVSLQSQSAAQARAYGIACVVDNGRSKQFVVYVYGAAATVGDQAYQVWLIENGVRRSAGTFRVNGDDKGVGVLAMPIQSDTLTFDAIGITLEPDDKGDRPRGDKIFGSV